MSTLNLRPFIVHEADIALFHAWPDGRPLAGPLDRHLASGIVALFRAGLSIGRAGGGSAATSFGDWRLDPTAPGEWTIETSAPLGALTDGAVQVSAPCPGIPLVILVRFHDVDTRHWRFWQFHDAELAEGNAADAPEVMMTGYRFRAGHREEWMGAAGDALPAMVPRLRGAIDWCHGGRKVRCWDYDAGTDTWTELPENHITVGPDTFRYVTLDFDGDEVAVSYLTPRTETMAAGAAGIDITRLGWLDARAFSVLSSGLTLEPGWTLETEGCAEPLAIAPSARHWDHARVTFRFLGRPHATLSHGVLAIPSLADGAPDVPPLDYPIRLGRLLLLPESAHLLPP